MLGFWHKCTNRSKSNFNIKFKSPYHSLQMSTQRQNSTSMYVLTADSAQQIHRSWVRRWVLLVVSVQKVIIQVERSCSQSINCRCLSDLQSISWWQFHWLSSPNAELLFTERSLLRPMAALIRFLSCTIAGCERRKNWRKQKSGKIFLFQTFIKFISKFTPRKLFGLWWKKILNV